MKKIIILDFSTGEVHIFDYDSATIESYEEYYEILNEEHGTHFNDSSCQCMIVEDLSIQIH